MTRTCSVFLLLSLAASALACSAEPSSPDADSSEDGEEAIVAARYLQTVPFRPAAEIDEKTAAFRERNGSAWRHVPLFTGDDGDRLNGVLTEMRREDAFGPDVAVGKDGAITLAKAFLAANADLFGLTGADLAAAAFGAEPITGSDYTWLVSARGERKQAGYEAFDTVTSIINPTVSIGRDGTVRHVSRGGPNYPHLTVATTPPRAANDARVLEHVVGRDLVWAEAPHSYIDTHVKRVDVGVVAASDVTAAEPMIEVEPANDSTSFRLVWDLTVTRGGHSWDFVVDPTNGRVLRWGQIDW